MPDFEFPKLLTQEEAALAIGVTPETLCTWRHLKRYPLAYVKVGRFIRYRPEDITDFLNRCRVVPRDARADLAKPPRKLQAARTKRAPRSRSREVA
jgi:hypothetical protein